MPPPLVDFEAYLATPKNPDVCWLWPGHINRDGYGMWSKNSAHRAMHERLVGPIPDGLEVDHLCRVRACVNPAHMECVTHRENIMRSTNPFAVKARATHCVNGHAFVGRNVIARPDGTRSCRECMNAAQRRYQARKRASA